MYTIEYFIEQNNQHKENLRSYLSTFDSKNNEAKLLAKEKYTFRVTKNRNNYILINGTGSKKYYLDSVAELVTFFKKHTYSCISNISAIPKEIYNIYKLKQFEVQSIVAILKNNKTAENIYFKKVDNINKVLAKSVLIGIKTKVLYSINDDIFVVEQGNNLYVFSEYILTINNTFDLSGLNCKYLYIDNLRILCDSLSCFLYDCTLLEKVELKYMDTKAVDYMANFCFNCTNLKYFIIDKFYTNNVISFSDFFENCFSLEKLDLRKFDTSNLLCIDSMFSGCTNLRYLNINNWNVSKVMDIDDFVKDCNHLEKVSMDMFQKTLSKKNRYIIDKIRYYLEH